MKKLAAGLLLLAFLALPCFGAPSTLHHVWYVTSPDHEQTFTYGTEQNRSWNVRGRPRHLVLFLNYTSDPFVDRNNPRQYDYFSFDFPSITLDADNHTFSYRTPSGRSIPVAARHSGFLGITQIDLLPTSELIIKKPHGYLTLSILIEDPSFF